MSATVDFYADTARTTGEAGTKRMPVLPAALLMHLVGRRVTVLLSVRQEEIEGELAKMDLECGDLFLKDAVHYQWRESDGEGQDFSNSTGGGSRKVLRQSKAMMVNSKYVDLITPSIFGATNA